MTKLNFSRSAIDNAFNTTLLIFCMPRQENGTRSELTLRKLFKVAVGTGGPGIRLGPGLGSEPQRPDGVLICIETGDSVGLLSQDYIVSGHFGLIEDHSWRRALAEEYGNVIERINYDNSINILG